MTSWREIIRDDAPSGPFRVAIFDFDGTLSLLRRNWQATMIPMMVEILKQETPTEETTEELERIVEDFVMTLNGKQTIYQMIRLTEEIRRRGGTPRDPLEYKHLYHERLWEHVRKRVEAVRSGAVSPDEMTVPGSRELLRLLREHDFELYLASGTDRHYVVDELRTLQLDAFFGEHVYGALDDYRRFSKAMILQQILRDCQVDGNQIVAFGDGFVEIEETVRVGGLAIGVASNEETREGINAWKRQRLIRAGAHWIIGDYRHADELVACLVDLPLS